VIDLDRINTKNKIEKMNEAEETPSLERRRRKEKLSLYVADQ